MNLCSGWDAGGPWITPEHACKKVVQAEVTVKGPRKFAEKLPAAAGDAQHYRDIIVQAFRETPDPDRVKFQVTVSSARGSYPGRHVADADINST